MDDAHAAVTEIGENHPLLVNCQKGVSRSSAAVLAYLMLRHNMTAVDALIEVGIGSFVINHSETIQSNFRFGSSGT